jgi:perosamine synthetase
MERILGNEELELLREAVNSQSLWRGMKGNWVWRFEEAMQERLGRKYAYATNSGTSANEAAVAGLGLEPGDEVICPASAPIFVSLPVFAAGCIPVFADVDPRTLIISPEGIEARISRRTKAVVVVHLFGQPAPMDEIMAMASRHRLRVIEDCAQAYDSFYKGKMVGTIGDVACFSLQQSKHITSGEGGFIVTDDPEIYKRALLYSNAGMPWYLYGLQAPAPDPVAGMPTRGHFAFGHNHRMNELQAAVAVAQLGKLKRFNAERRTIVGIIEDELRGCPGILLAHVYPETQPVYWAYPVQLNPGKTPLTAYEVFQTFKVEGIRWGCYQEINYLEHVFRRAQEQRRTPFGYPLPDHVSYEPGLCPKAEEGARRTILTSANHNQNLGQVREHARLCRQALERLVGAQAT